jgi:hypothetical protein
MLGKYHLVVSDSSIDSFGVEFYINEELTLDIYRVDEGKRRVLRFYTDSLDLEYVEECLDIFKREIPRDFVP